jgi:uncharacterized protein
MHEVRRLIDQFVGMTERMGDAVALQALAAFQEVLFRDLEEKLAVLQANLRAEPLTLTDLPPALRTRYMGKSGKFRLFVFAAQDIWEFHPLAQFVADLKAVDPQTLGAPIMNFEYLRGMKEAYERAGLYAFLGIVFLVIVTFRAMQPTLTVLPSVLALLASGQTKEEGLASKSWPTCLESPFSSRSTADRGG